ncbi:MAG: choice-of-anchor R domain-containing protein [bacterium]|nr:choice-of-anchor R domain-containing protein [bacterium]
MKLETRNYKSGQAALIAVIFMMTIMLSAIFGVIGLSLKEARVAGKNYKSRNSFFVAEAGIDDAVYRLLRGKNLSSSYTISLNGATADIDVTNISSNTRRIVSSGDASGSNRSLSANLVTGTDSVSFFYGVQVGDGGMSISNNAQVNGNVYSNGSIVGGNGAKITESATVAGGISSTPSIEWATQDSDQFFATASSNRDIAQSFMATAGGNLSKVSVYLGKVGAPSGNITLKISTDNSNKPSTSNIASATIANSSVGVTPSWIDVSFSSPPNLTNGAKYWIVLDYGSNSATNYWNWKKDSTGGYINNTGKYTSNCCSGSPVWTDVGGDLDFRVWIGGTVTSISGLTIGNSTTGSGRANLFTNTIIHGSACPNQYCVIDNPAREEMPISDGVIQDWKDAAMAGGICGPPICDSLGNLDLDNSAILSLGPIKIPGTMTLHNGVTLTMTGTIWVVGDMEISNNSTVKLTSSYGSNSGVILTDGESDIHNNAMFLGSGQTGSYIMLLGAKNAPLTNVMEVDNGSVGVIYYAPTGRIHFHNNASAKEATAYGIDMDNNSVITYESGLANVNFSSGPAGGWDIIEWKEIIP